MVNAGLIGNANAKFGFGDEDQLQLAVLLAAVNWIGAIMVLLITLCFARSLVRMWLHSRPARSRGGVERARQSSSGFLSDADDELCDTDNDTIVVVFAMEQNKMQDDRLMWAFDQLFAGNVKYVTLQPNWKCAPSIDPQLKTVLKTVFSGSPVAHPHLTKLDTAMAVVASRAEVRPATAVDFTTYTRSTAVEAPHRKIQNSTLWHGFYVASVDGIDYLVTVVRWFGCPRMKQLVDKTREGLLGKR